MGVGQTSVSEIPLNDARGREDLRPLWENWQRSRRLPLPQLQDALADGVIPVCFSRPENVAISRNPL